MARILVILESPGKIRKVQEILGENYKVMASGGHIRELADSGCESLGFTLQHQPPRVYCNYVAREGSEDAMKRLHKAVNKYDEAIVATDPDREGECIAWHLMETLKFTRPPKRASFSAIVPEAVKAAIASPRSLDKDLVAAARARDCLDKLVGYKLSPLLWNMNNGAQSAGRCQSAALGLICQQDRQIQAWQPTTYWQIHAQYRGDIQAQWFEPEDNTTRLDSQQQAKAIAITALKNKHYVEQVETEVKTISPPPPFTTSTLLSVAGGRLGFSTSKVMRCAQALYEQGYITYHRSDSVQVSPQFQSAARHWLETHDPERLPPQPPQFHSRGQTQEGHEAIRPTHLSDRTLAADSDDLKQLYQLIWCRAIASQCCAAKVEVQSIIIVSDDLRFRLSGRLITETGYSKYWQNLAPDKTLPTLTVGQQLIPTNIQPQRRQTSPPSPWSESQFVQKLEKTGIGRPSTTAHIISTLIGRQYIKRYQGQLIPTKLGLEVDRFLRRSVPEIVTPNFTAEMEVSLDRIAQGKQEWQEYLVDFHDSCLQPALNTAQAIISEEYSIPTDEPVEMTCHFCDSPTLVKKYSNSPKLERDHYLICPACESPHFWDEEAQTYQLPYKLRRRAMARQEKKTNHRCPVCNAPLVEHYYEKSGKTKTMLRCSQINQNACLDVAYFKTKKSGNWWSPKFGILNDKMTIDLQEIAT